MSSAVSVEHVPARSLAAVRRRVRTGEIGMAWKPALDEVWAFLRGSEGLWAGGHNVFLYRGPADRDALMDIDFGVEVVGPFQASGAVRHAVTPAGRAASTLHVGPYSGLPGAHDAIREWARARGEAFAGVSWEVYGHQGEDLGAVDVRVMYLLS